MSLLKPPIIVHMREGNPDENLKPNMGDIWHNQLNEQTYKWDGSFWRRVHTGGVVNVDDVVIRPSGMPAIYYNNQYRFYGFAHNNVEHRFDTHKAAWDAALKIAHELAVKPPAPEHYGDF